MLLVYPPAPPDSVWTPHAIADVLALREEYCGGLVIAASCRAFILFRKILDCIRYLRNLYSLVRLAILSYESDFH